MKKLLTGLIGGIALGILFAPEKGEKTRKKLLQSDEALKDFGIEMLTTGKNISDEVKKFLESKEVKEIIKKGKDNFIELHKKGKTLSKKGKDELTTLISQAKEKISKKIKEKRNVKNSRSSNDVLNTIKNFFEDKK